jgi:hypothetical protein
MVGLYILAFGLLTPRPASATSIVVNGDFETGTFAGWTTQPEQVGVSVFGVSASHVHAGLYAAFFAGEAAGFDEGDTIFQTLPTTAGQTYLVDLWLEMDIAPPFCPVVSTANNCDAEGFRAYWNGVPILTLASLSQFNYREYTFLLTATGPSSTIRFTASNTPGFWRLDDVSVTATPEPTSLLLLGSGVLTALRWRGRRADRVRRATLREQS